MIAPYFPPRPRVGSRRPFHFAKYLPDFGWEPTIMTLTRFPRSGAAPSAPGTIKVLPIVTPWDATTSRNNAFASGRNSLFSLGERLFPVDTWLPVMSLNLFRLIREAARVQPDVVWSTADPWSSHVLAYGVASALQIPWVADYRDPWTMCQIRNRKRFKIVQTLDRTIECQLVRRAAALVFTARTTEARYRQIFGENLPAHTIYNSFDDAFSGLSPRNAPETQTLEVAFLGRFRPLSPATRIIRVLVEAKKTSPKVAGRIRVHSFGRLTSDDQAEVIRNGLADQFVIHDPVTPEETAVLLNAFDVFLVSVDPERNDIIPAKLWDYLPFAQPILSLSDNNEIHDILFRTGRGVQFGIRASQNAAQWLLALLSMSRHQRIMPSVSSQVQSYHAIEATAKLAHLFDQVVTDALSC